jgi:hypothetical protein
MAGTTPAAADPDIPAKEAQSRAPEESIEAAERLQPVHTNLRLLDPPKAMPSAYDAILRPLGLLDFVRLDLSASGVPRPDLVAELIANYSSSRECSTVRGKKIEVSFKSFAKALCLPLYIVPVGSLKYGGGYRHTVSRVYSVPGWKHHPSEPMDSYKKRTKDGTNLATWVFWELVKLEMEQLVE